MSFKTRRGYEIRAKWLSKTFLLSPSNCTKLCECGALYGDVQFQFQIDLSTYWNSFWSSKNLRDGCVYRKNLNANIQNNLATSENSKADSPQKIARVPGFVNPQCSVIVWVAFEFVFLFLWHSMTYEATGGFWIHKSILRGVQNGFGIAGSLSFHLIMIVNRMCYSHEGRIQLERRFSKEAKQLCNFAVILLHLDHGPVCISYFCWKENQKKVEHWESSTKILSEQTTMLVRTF